MRSLYSGVSRGTESLVFRGEVPESEYQRMRAPFQEGDFPGPVKYGYISVGVVEDGMGAEAAALRGRTVFCLHPHQARYVVPASAVIPLPPGLPPARAVLAANMETAINACWDGAPGVGDRIAVVGAGVVGSLVAAVRADLRHRGRADRRRPGARDFAALGLTHRPPAAARAECDLVFHASGHPAGLSTALELAAQEASVIEMSLVWPHARERAARRRLPCPPAQHPIQPGRPHPAAAQSALDFIAGAWNLRCRCSSILGSTP